jgi:4'-phosphopantetheinyl transferase
MNSFGTKQVRVAAPAIKWHDGPATPAISANEVHIWKVDLSSRLSAELDSVLSADEEERASRFHFERDRKRFKIAHGSLRMILSGYLKLAPAQLTFDQTDYGKPFLTNIEAAGFLFNMSHSGDLALIAVARDREVGIDIELVRPDFATMEVAEHFFSVAEIYTLSGLDPHLRTSAFFNCWTRKEAYVKARGEGLSMPLDQFDVSLAPGVATAMLGNRIDESERSRWFFQNLEVAPNYAGALVVEALTSEPLLSCFSFAS